MSHIDSFLGPWYPRCSWRGPTSCRDRLALSPCNQDIRCIDGKIPESTHDRDKYTCDSCRLQLQFCHTYHIRVPIHGDNQSWPSTRRQSDLLHQWSHRTSDPQAPRTSPPIQRNNDSPRPRERSPKPRKDYIMGLPLPNHLRSQNKRIRPWTILPGTKRQDRIFLFRRRECSNRGRRVGRR